MIKAQFQGTDVIIDLTKIEQKYMGKEISFTLFYGYDLLDGTRTSFTQAGTTSLVFNGQSTATIKLDKVQEGYRGEKIFIGYSLEVNLGSKYLIFSDKEDVEIQGRESQVYNVKNLDVQSGIYKNHNDTSKVLDVVKNMSIIFKILLGIGGLFLAGSIWGFTSASPIFDSIFFLGLSMFFIVVIYMLGRGHYIDVTLNTDNLVKNTDIKSIIQGVAKRNLKDIEIQLFGINNEKGNYEVRSGSTTRTVYVNKEVGNVLLFKESIYSIEKGEKLENYLRGNIDIQKIYDKLFPSIEITRDTGLFLTLELRVISKDLKDIIKSQAIHLDSSKFINIFDKEEKNIIK